MQEPEINSEIDELCDRFERDIQQSNNVKIESYIAHFNTQEKKQALYWLLRTEFEVNRKHEIPNLAEYRERFPGFEDTITLAFGTGNHFDQPIPNIDGYEIIKLISCGGQGGVYQAKQLRTGQDVAIKFISNHSMTQTASESTKLAFNNFESEVRIAATLRHPNSVRLYDAGQCDDGVFLVMELIQGGDLSQRHSEFNQYQAVDLIQSIAEAVAEAHRAKVLHLDIKPKNILFDEHNMQPRLVDFGLAKLEAIGETFASVSGTPGYMAPEQVNKKVLDQRTDVFGLGATLYFLLTGRRPIAGETIEQVINNSKTPKITPPSRIKPAIAALIERVCLKCLQTAPADRYQTVGELADDLARIKQRNGAQQMVKMSNGLNATGIALIILNASAAMMIWQSVNELFIWPLIFLIYVPLFVVFYKYPVGQDDKSSATQEVIWVIWIGKLVSEIFACLALRMMVDDANQAFAIAFPLFMAFGGFAIFCSGPQFWSFFYFMAVFYWIMVPVVALLASVHPALGPISYGSTALGIFAYSYYLRKVNKQVSLN